MLAKEFYLTILSLMLYLIIDTGLWIIIGMLVEALNAIGILGCQKKFYSTFLSLILMICMLLGTLNAYGILDRPLVECFCTRYTWENGSNDLKIQTRSLLCIYLRRKNMSTSHSVLKKSGIKKTIWYGRSPTGSSKSLGSILPRSIDFSLWLFQ